MRRGLVEYVPLLLWVTTTLDRISIGSATPDAKYLGCFKDVGNPRVFKGHVDHLGGNLTPQKCVELCYSKGFLYSATQDSSYCFCGDKPPHPTSKASEDRCSKPCSGNPAEKCGGEDSISVSKTGIPDYPEADQYLGCFEDTYHTFKDVLLTYHKTNTPRRCMNTCLQLRYKYAGVQNSKECLCGNVELGAELARQGDECRWPCSGDASDFCGGNLRVALYSTGVVSVAEGGWPPPGKKKYYVETEKQGDWHESLMACLRNKTRLATVDNYNEFEELRAAIKHTGKRLGNFYLSAADVGQEGNYVWVTSGKQLSGAKGPMWPDHPYNTQPDNWENNENCIEIWERYDWQGYYLNDRPCGLKGNYVCEYYIKQ